MKGVSLGEIYVHIGWLPSKHLIGEFSIDGDSYFDYKPT